HTLNSFPTRRSSDLTKQIFETTALAIKGAQAGTYYGSIQWGWKTDNAGTHTKIPFQAVSEGVPSSSFLKAAELWNASTDSTGRADRKSTRLNSSHVK